MIRLDIQGYCSDCPYFEAVIKKHDNSFRDEYANKIVPMCDTDIRCKNETICANIAKYIEKKITTEGTNND